MSKTERGAKSYAKRHGFDEVYARPNNGYDLDLVAVRINGEWCPPEHVWYIYITDLFGGELNYTYKRRFVVRAATERGAVCKVSKYTGLRFRNEYDEVYHSRKKLVGLVIESAGYDGILHDEYFNAEIT